MILVIDNYDSFTYNLVQYLGELGADLRVFRNDAISVSEVDKLGPDAIVLSPGPGRPEDSGVCLEIVKMLHDRIPILGVCLGHQAIAYSFGGTIDRAPRLMHGKTSTIHHTGQGIPVLGGMSARDQREFFERGGYYPYARIGNKRVLH